ncbi:hypothetical protein SBDP2_340007 [Syntrophobacter sp. SbD2]|nr:hypothetical protein SBDP2_340007 [Syntrophobacter sp. SbD2]
MYKSAKEIFFFNTTLKNYAQKHRKQAAISRSHNGGQDVGVLREIAS